jgi:hypothetical protein
MSPFSKRGPGCGYRLRPTSRQVGPTIVDGVSTCNSMLKYAIYLERPSEVRHPEVGHVKIGWLQAARSDLIDDSMCIPRSPCLAALAVKVKGGCLNPNTSRAPHMSHW